MSEEAWYKMLAVSFALHIFVLAAFSIPMKFTSKRFDLSSSYSVNLVGSVGNLGGGQKEGAAPEIKKTPEKPVPVKSKPIPIKKEKDLVSLSKKKTPAKETTTQEELDQLQKKIQNIKKKTEYFDMAKSAGGGSGRGGTGGLPFPGGGSGNPPDPLTQKYYLDIFDKIRAAWSVLPGTASFKKDLETIVVIKIRKDGRIVDINIEKRSGIRVYDESVQRALLAAEPLPPIPAALNMDYMEIGYRFQPGDLR
jgi:TonB family protein